jgi:uncharacterized protein
MEVVPALISRVDAAEEALEELGIRELRVRLDSPDEARIEIAKHELMLLDGKDSRDRLIKKFTSLGFKSIALDLEGYRSGSMDESRTGRHCIIMYSEKRARRENSEI